MVELLFEVFAFVVVVVVVVVLVVVCVGCIRMWLSPCTTRISKSSVAWGALVTGNWRRFARGESESGVFTGETGALRNVCWYQLRMVGFRSSSDTFGYGEDWREWVD